MRDVSALEEGLQDMAWLSDGRLIYVAGEPDIPVTDAIDFGTEHGLSTGDRVTYLAGGAGAIEGLTDQSSYSVITVNPTAVRLGATFAAANVDPTSDTIRFSNVHNLANGQRVFFGNTGGTAVTGLSVGAAYFVRVLDAHTIKLFNSAAEATAASKLFSAADVNNTSHTLSLPGHLLTENQAVAYTAPPSQQFGTANISSTTDTELLEFARENIGAERRIGCTDSTFCVVRRRIGSGTYRARHPCFSGTVP